MTVLFNFLLAILILGNCIAGVRAAPNGSPSENNSHGGDSYVSPASGLLTLSVLIVILTFIISFLPRGRNVCAHHVQVILRMIADWCTAVAVRISRHTQEQEIVPVPVVLPPIVQNASPLVWRNAPSDPYVEQDNIAAGDWLEEKLNSRTMGSTSSTNFVFSAPTNVSRTAPHSSVGVSNVTDSRPMEVVGLVREQDIDVNRTSLT